MKSNENKSIEGGIKSAAEQEPLYADHFLLLTTPFKPPDVFKEGFLEV